MNVRREIINLGTAFSVLAIPINASAQSASRFEASNNGAQRPTYDFADNVTVVKGQTVERIRIPFSYAVPAGTVFFETACFLGAAKSQTPDNAPPSLQGSDVDPESSKRYAFSLLGMLNGEKSAVCFQRNAVVVDASSLPSPDEIGINNDDTIQRAHVRFPANWTKLSR